MVLGFMAATSVLMGTLVMRSKGVTGCHNSPSLYSLLVSTTSVKHHSLAHSYYK